MKKEYVMKIEKIIAKVDNQQYSYEKAVSLMEDVVEEEFKRRCDNLLRKIKRGV